MIKRDFKLKSRFKYAGPKALSNEEDVVLYKKLLAAIFGIFAVLTLFLLTLQFLGPKIFSVYSLLSLDRQKKDEEKLQSATPSFTDTPKATKSKFVTLKGFSEPQSKVKLFVNGPEADNTTSDQEGKFTFENVSLLEGQNIIFAKSEAPNKVESDKSETLYVIYDLKKPEIFITSPKNGEEIESVDSRIPVKGSVNEEASVFVNSHLTIVDSEGNFQTLIAVKEGPNVVKVTAIDTAGNESTSSITVKFDKR
ncbi:hypothetical protein A2716_03260 [candidate division WWE3 bacterium RIFCSPHIGHO2_01_FULL_40_23]|uniref:Bacterial Ig domain-containing protein n=1 Tax=candidate division WWE3 bacterium RIFCSPLOWO2_01_FULL_41_18 TaxID=1802625 RepID=A0A1F4VCP5_UNCKA|nr:MAG: hypothetical protein A2716_03260 [candidate division WWE3 bacterium RIFCSPHIGHO2_01_FULL_40_23]OGC54899.1 MAG: hypothetical protein A3A78_02870 [candidate division WWE3 bacterium RIFCSPLOWO2_01_FULL_41_18]